MGCSGFDPWSTAYTPRPPPLTHPCRSNTLDCRADATVLQVLTTAGVLKGEVALAGNAGPVTIPNAQLVALLGAETDFTLRAFYSLAGLRSLNFDEITVRKA